MERQMRHRSSLCSNRSSSVFQRTSFIQNRYQSCWNSDVIDRRHAEIVGRLSFARHLYTKRMRRAAQVRPDL